MFIVIYTKYRDRILSVESSSTRRHKYPVLVWIQVYNSLVLLLTMH